MDRSRAAQPFLFVGNHPCLDFINTEMILEGRRTDLLVEPTDLIHWLVQAKVIGRDEGKGMGPERAELEKLLKETKMFRAVLRETAERIAANKPVPGSTIEAVNQLLSRRQGYPQLLRMTGGFKQIFYSSAEGPGRLLALLAETASDLLCNADLSLVKKCRNNVCILYFYDTTKNHARQWCSMQLCGNRMKVAAHYQRKRFKQP